jgi:hypothetical protein
MPSRLDQSDCAHMVLSTNWALASERGLIACTAIPSCGSSVWSDSHFVQRPGRRETGLGISQVIMQLRSASRGDEKGLAVGLTDGIISLSKHLKRASVLLSWYFACSCARGPKSLSDAA